MMTIEELKRNNSPEIAAVILICRVFLKTSPENELKDFFDVNRLDEKLFLKIVRAHNIRPLVYKVISDLKVTGEITNRLNADCKKIALKNFEQYRELIKLNSIFEANNVTAIPYKGCVFGLQFFNDIGMRESSDIDFLIRPDANDIRAITKLMLADGYNAGDEIPEAFAKYYYEHTREIKFFLFEDGKRKFLAEFHSLLNDPVFETQSPIPNEYLFRGRSTVTLNENVVETLSPTNLLLAVITHHGIAGQWSSLKNIIDLAKAAKRNDIDWKVISAASHTYRFSKVLDIGLGLAEELLGVVPRIKASKMTDHGPWRKRLLSNHEYALDRSWRNNFLLKLKSKDSTGDSIRLAYEHIRHAGAPSILDYKFIKLPKPLFFLYIFVKPIRMLVAKGSSRQK